MPSTVSAARRTSTVRSRPGRLRASRRGCRRGGRGGLGRLGLQLAERGSVGGKLRFVLAAQEIGERVVQPGHASGADELIFGQSGAQLGDLVRSLQLGKAGG